MIIFFAVALLGILATGLSIFGEHYGFAQNIATFAFLSIVLGTLVYVVRFK